jgi:hypothetical protein
VRFAPKFAAFAANPEFCQVAFASVDIDLVDDKVKYFYHPYYEIY